MKVISSIGCIVVLAFVFKTETVAQGETYKTEIFRDDIKSLVIKVEGELFANPFIELGSDKKLEISFDALRHSRGRFAYKVIHCDADWTQSALAPVEYIKGFQQATIEDFANSFNTTTHFMNYILTFPNPDMRLTASGNYVVQIFDEDSPQDVVLNACFSIVEPHVDISPTISENTDIDFKQSHQQVSFSLTPTGLDVPFPQRDLKIFVYKNNFRDDLRTVAQPRRINGRELVYEHEQNLIFDAGNEYRRIEFLTHRYNGMGVEHIKYVNPYYHVTLRTEKTRHQQTYLYDQDQNGRFFINCSKCDDPQTEGDYYIVHFSLASEFVEEAEVHIFGGLFHHILDGRSRMEYNATDGVYEKSVMLKQGLYNYQYVVLKKGEVLPTLAFTEGNFYEAENEYTITVYYRSPGDRYDRLVGLAIVSSKHAFL